MMPVIDTVKRRARLGGRKSPLAGQISALYCDGNNNALKILSCCRKTKKKGDKAKAYDVTAAVYNDIVGGQSVVINVSDMLYQVEEGTEGKIVMRTDLTPPNYVSSNKYCSDTKRNLTQLLEVMSRLAYMVQYGEIEGDLASAEDSEEKKVPKSGHLTEFLDYYNRTMIAVIYCITEICPCFDIDFMD